MQLNLILTVLKKELRETVRDRRSLYSSLLMPVLGAMLMVFLVNKFGDRANETKELDLHVQGAEHAPRLIERLKQQHLNVVTAPQEPLVALKRKTIAALLVIPSSYDQDLASSTQVPLKLKGDLSNGITQQTVRRAKRALAGYGAQIGSLRMAARGVAMRLVHPFEITTVNLASDNQRATQLMQLLLTFVLISACVGGMYVAIDATAGERERKSLEPLLNTPVSTMSLLLGKWLATAVMGLLTCLMTLTLLRQALLWSPYEELGLNISLSLLQAFGLFLCIAPLSLLMSALQLVIGIFARSYREAQTYMATFMILPLLPTYLYDSDTGPAALWMHAVPSLGQHIQSLTILRGEQLPWIQPLLASVCCLGLIPCILYILATLLRRESTIYGR